MSRLRILVLGYVVRRPFGGQAWHYLQYLLGLHQLGHEVYYLEDSGPFPDCLDPFHQRYGWDAASGVDFLHRSLERLGLGGRWAYYDDRRAEWSGPCANRIVTLHRTADLLLNVSGLNVVRPWFDEVPRRCLIDTDPVFTQVRHLTHEHFGEWGIYWDPQWLRRHQIFFSFGENFRRPGCTIPDDGLPWQPTRQPIVLDAWPVAAPASDGKFTSVLSWQTYQRIEFNGVKYGIKRDSLERFIDIPRQTGSAFEMVVQGRHCPREDLRQHGWEVRDPAEEVADPWAYQRYLQRSKAEFSVAKEGYVVTHSGWFSERSACYLASGRPVIVQDTGFGEWLRAQQGVLPFSGKADSVAVVRELEANYETHCRAAREAAETYFDSRKVLGSLLERASASATTGRERAQGERPTGRPSLRIPPEA